MTETVHECLRIEKARIVHKCLDATDVFVSANDRHVVFTDGDMLAAGLKLTIEQWNRVVEFVDSQVLGASDRDWVGDWSKVPASVNYVAKDENGWVWGCDVEMEFTGASGNKYWMGDSNGHKRLNDLRILAKNIPAEKSQVKRPGV